MCHTNSNAQHNYSIHHPHLHPTQNDITLNTPSQSTTTSIVSPQPQQGARKCTLHQNCPTKSTHILLNCNHQRCVPPNTRNPPQCRPLSCTLPNDSNQIKVQEEDEIVDQIKMVCNEHPDPVDSNKPKLLQFSL